MLNLLISVKSMSVYRAFDSSQFCRGSKEIEPLSIDTVRVLFAKKYGETSFANKYFYLFFCARISSDQFGRKCCCVCGRARGVISCGKITPGFRTVRNVSLSRTSDWVLPWCCCRTAVVCSRKSPCPKVLKI